MVQSEITDGRIPDLEDAVTDFPPPLPLPLNSKSMKWSKCSGTGLILHMKNLAWAFCCTVLSTASPVIKTTCPYSLTSFLTVFKTRPGNVKSLLRNLSSKSKYPTQVIISKNHIYVFFSKESRMPPLCWISLPFLTALSLHGLPYRRQKQKGGKKEIKTVLPWFRGLYQEFGRSCHLRTTRCKLNSRATRSIPTRHTLVSPAGRSRALEMPAGDAYCWKGGRSGSAATRGAPCAGVCPAAHGWLWACHS